MIKFAKFDNEYVMTDDATIKKYGVSDVIEITEEEFYKYGCDYHNENGTLVLGASQQKIAKEEILKLKQWLANTDYIAIKYAEGVISEDEYLDIKTQRQLWRDGINELEKVL